MTEQRQDDRQSGQNSTLPNSPQSVSTKGIKAFVSSHLPSDHPLRLLISSEKDKLTVNEFMVKLDDWLKLLGFKS